MTAVAATTKKKPVTTTLASYSPINTLARQYHTKTGEGRRRVFFFVKLNAACCLPGGVESIVKGTAVVEEEKVEPAADGDTTTDNGEVIDDSSSPPTDGDQEVSSNGEAAKTGDNGDQAAATKPALDPFSDLDEATATSDPSTTPPRPSTSRRIGRFLSKTAHSIAVRSNKGKNANPDLLRLGLYNAKDELICATEWQPLPRDEEAEQQKANEAKAKKKPSRWGRRAKELQPEEEVPKVEIISANTEPKFKGVLFHIPLVVPASGEANDDEDDDEADDSANSDGAMDITSNLRVRLWITSGSKLFTTRNFLLGSANVNTGLLLPPPDTVGTIGGPVELPLQSPLLSNEAKLSMFAMMDHKYVGELEPGWTLIDPRMDAYMLTRHQTKLYHHPPLDQSYAFGTPTLKETSLIVATERATESTCILPVVAAFAQLAGKACRVSLAHAETATTQLLGDAHDAPVGVYTDVELKISHVEAADEIGLEHVDSKLFEEGVTQCLVSGHWQRPNQVFEVDIVKPTLVPVGEPPAGFIAAVATRFFPKPVKDGILPGLLEARRNGALPESGFMLGSIRFCIKMLSKEQAEQQDRKTSRLRSMFGGSTDAAKEEEDTEEDFLECWIDLDDIYARGADAEPVQYFPLVETTTGHTVGKMCLHLTASLQEGADADGVSSSTSQDGLVSLVGLRPLNGVQSNMLDFDSPLIESTDGKNEDQPKVTRIELERQAQLSMSGGYMSHAYLEQHVNDFREDDSALLDARASHYMISLQELVHAAAGTGDPDEHDADEDEVMPHQKLGTPRPFRPSSSKTEILLAGLPINVHTVTVTVSVKDTNDGNIDSEDSLRQALFYNLTCGAPADHVAGFDDVFSKSNLKVQTKDHSERDDDSNPMVYLNPYIGTVSGGLAQLEYKRQDIADLVAAFQEELSEGIVQYLDLQQAEKEKKAKEVAAAKANGVAGDSEVPSNDSVAGTTPPLPTASQQFHVPASHNDLLQLRWKVFDAVQSLHHLTWICAVRRSTVFSQALGIAVSTFLVCLSDKTKCQSNWPEVWVKHGFVLSVEGFQYDTVKEAAIIGDAYVGIRMLHMLSIQLVNANDSDDFGEEVVDVDLDRVQVPFSKYLKWVRLTTSGQNATRRFTLTIGVDAEYYSDYVPEALQAHDAKVRLYPLLFRFPGGLVNDIVDSSGDDDVCNSTAFQLLNEFAYKLEPTVAKGDSLSDSTEEPQQPLHLTHPLLEKFREEIDRFDGEMNHEILHQVASLVATKFGGGTAIFCKSGKDQTAMHITYQQAKFTNSFLDTLNSGEKKETTVEDANMWRIHGTRLAICEKNIGQPYFAFNTAEVRCLPPVLKPPTESLKRGLFSGAAVES